MLIEDVSVTPVAFADRYGFTALELKGGVFPPRGEIAAVRALRAAFPDHPRRLDPNGAWSVVTSIRVGGLGDGIAVRVVLSDHHFGVELDRAALARLHEQYLACGLTERDDTGCYRRSDPTFDPTPPRW
jgi:enolase-like protein